MAHFFFLSEALFFNYLIKKKICKISAFCWHLFSLWLLLKDNAHWSDLSLHYKEYTGLPLPPNYQRQTARWRTVCMCMWGWGGFNYRVLLHRNMELRNTTVAICQPWKYIYQWCNSSQKNWNLFKLLVSCITCIYWLHIRVKTPPSCGTLHNNSAF